MDRLRLGDHHHRCGKFPPVVTGARDGRGSGARGRLNLIINKTDLIAPESLVEFKREIRKLNDRAVVTETRYGYINPRLFYDADLELKADTTEGLSAGQHAPAPPGWQEGITTIAFPRLRVDYRTARKMDDLVAKLSNVPPNMFRIKGVVQIESGSNVLVQFVGGGDMR